jgi:hypothetical protein
MWRVRAGSGRSNLSYRYSPTAFEEIFMQRQSSMRMLAIGFVIVGAIHAIMVLFILVVYGGKARITPDTAQEFLPVIGLLGQTSFVLVLIASLLGVFTGVGLWHESSWGRSLGIAVSVVQIFVIPFGTILGVAGLFLLCRKQALNKSP